MLKDVVAHDEIERAIAQWRKTVAIHIDEDIRFDEPRDVELRKEAAGLLAGERIEIPDVAARRKRRGTFERADLDPVATEDGTSLGPVR
jgi:hypothetical protein